MTVSPQSPQPRYARILLRGVAAACGLIAAFIAIRYAGQKPLDHFSFRQTQTALTAFWLQRDGFSLAYETPVGGPPWSLPFEFPIYQWIVASLSRWTGASLDATARLVSFAFLVGCVVPVRSITTTLRLSPLVFPIFCALLLSSPTYVYWGRTVMIETTALFFCVVAIRHFVDLLAEPRSRRSAALFVVFLTLGFLQKITTALPVLLVLGGVLVVTNIRKWRVPGQPFASRDVVIAAMCLAIPLLVGLAWTHHTDQIKLLSAFGRHLTSDALRSWNVGTLEQRLTAPLYDEVIGDRIFGNNLAGYFGVAILVVGLYLARSGPSAKVSWIALALGLLPDLLFANLHLFHDYYECGNLIFVLFAVAVTLGDVLARRIRWPWVLVAATVVIVVSNYRVFTTEYAPVVRMIYTDTNDTEVALANVIGAEVPADKLFVAYDFDWSSALAYLSQRKALMVSDLFDDAPSARVDPGRFVARDSIGAVVACPKTEATIRQLIDWSRRQDRWKIGAVDDCFVTVPESRAVVDPSTTGVVDCGVADLVVIPVPQSDTLRLVHLRIRRTTSAMDARYLVAVSSARPREMLQVSRPTIDDDAAASPTQRDHRYSLLIDADALAADVSPTVFRALGAQLAECRATITR